MLHKEEMERIWIYTIGTFAVGIIGGLFPLWGRWSSRQLHLFVAFGAGVFLGAVFLHILPEVTQYETTHLINALVLVGFMAILLLEKVLLNSHEECHDQACSHEHVVLSWTTLIGLCVHGLSEGVSLGLALESPKLASLLFIAIIAHTSAASFSLVTIFRLAGFSLTRAASLLLVFSLSTPVGALLSSQFLHFLPEHVANIPAALAAGTFVYVATCDLLPEAFHDSRNRVKSFIALVIGIGVMMLVPK